MTTMDYAADHGADSQHAANTYPGLRQAMAPTFKKKGFRIGLPKPKGYIRGWSIQDCCVSVTILHPDDVALENVAHVPWQRQRDDVDGNLAKHQTTPWHGKGTTPNKINPNK